MSSTRDPAGPETILAAWLARNARERGDFEVLCREHEHHAEALRRLYSGWQAVERELEPLTRDDSLAVRLEATFGSDVDPRITLRMESDDDGSGSSGEVLSRIADRGQRSTRYRVDGEIAHGGMGAVLGVWDEDLRRNLAMKIMLSRASRGSGPLLPADARALSRFLEEAQVTGQLDHPGIVPVHELGLDEDGHVYFTMKLVRGKTLAEVFAELQEGEGDWSQVRVLGLVAKVCEAMSYAHAKGVIHRDLKPSNVMVGRFGEVYVMDWGLAHVLGRADAKDIRLRDEEPATRLIRTSPRGDQESPSPELYTMDGDVVGTPAYMSPEQAAGELDAMGPHSDVYSIGAMLYHLMAGHAPYAPSDLRLNNYTIWGMVRQGPPKPLMTVAPDATAELVAIVEKAMEREPELRYRDTGDLARDLSNYLEGRVVSAYETGAWAEAKKWVGRNRVLAGTLAAAVLILVAGLVATSNLYVRAEDNAARAKEQEELAKEQESIATARADDVLRLSALQDLEDLVSEAHELWPPYPENRAAFEAWIARAQVLADELPRHREKRDELRAEALPRTEEERAAERSRHPEFDRLQELTGELAARERALARRRTGDAAPLPSVDWSRLPSSAAALDDLAWRRVDPARTSYGEEALGLVLALRARELAGGGEELRQARRNTLAWAYFALGRDEEALEAGFLALESAADASRVDLERDLLGLEEAVERATSPEGLATAEVEIARLAAERKRIDERVDERRDWRYPNSQPEGRWWDAQLTKLLEGLESLRDELLAPEMLSPNHGWSVTRRLSFARRLESGFASGGEFLTPWERDLPAIRAAYPGLELEPQLGLVPLGPDPGSGLWEFAHLLTGEPARRDEEGELVLTEATGVVLVLIPAGEFWMGAQRDDPGGRNYDPDAVFDEAPVHRVELSAFFLSKYEMTQGQWLAMAGNEPSGYRDEPLAPTRLHPVEQISWFDCEDWLPRVGLSLPSEAQWEYAARAGTTTIWYTGNERESIRGKVNLADQAAARTRATWTGIDDWPDLDDGYGVHAPIGAYPANPFGLHEVHGNVWEWCQDGLDQGFYGHSPTLDPVAPARDAVYRAARGGGFSNAASHTRVTFRDDRTPSLAGRDLGVRPARRVDG